MEYNVKYKRLQSPVDIIIPYHGHYHHLGECLHTIISQTFGQLYSITVVDDCSPNDFITDLEKTKLKNLPIQYLKHEEHKGFGAALRTGFDATQNQWVCFMHADCKVVRPDWLSEMVLSMQAMKNDGVKLISAKLSDGGTGAYDQCVLGDTSERPNKVSDQTVPLVCTLVHRDLFKNIGGFIKPYPYAGYEDEELYWRMKIKGFKQGVSGKAFVEHAGGPTMKGFQKKPEINKAIEENRERFVNDVREFAKKNGYK